MDIIPVVAIVIIAYLVGECVKITKIDNKFIPVICGIVGGILGVIAWLTAVDIGADNWLVACAVGIFYGLAATGSHQVIKQITEK